MIQAVITDIEGTTTSVSFVYDVLFPYAREHMAAYIRQHVQEDEVRVQLDTVASETGRSMTNEQAIEQLLAWMDEDRKITPLKTLQGLIWEEGYQLGRFKGHIYEDVPRSLRRWHDRGIALFVYSSGSVQAQKLLFANTCFGDLTPLFSGYFDTRIGGKRDAGSYERIIKQTGFRPQAMLFLSDIEQELEAAEQAGMHTMLLVRGGHREQGKFRIIQSFDQIELD
jgi:enolase-phosphatase E1